MRGLRGTTFVMAGALALSSLAVACGSTTRGGTGGPSSTSQIPTSTTTTAAPTSTSTTLPAGTIDVRVYFMHGDKIDVAHRSIQTTKRVATAALTQLLAGPTLAESAAGLSTAIPNGTRLLDVAIANRIATVDLSSNYASGGGSLSMLARLAQVTFTVTQFPTVDGVLFQMDGQPVTVFGGEGIVLDHPATRDTFESVTPPILVESPGRGWTVQSPVTVSGTANVYEAQFQAELTDAGGHVITTVSILATSGTGTRGSFTASIPFPASAAGPATLTVFDTSPKDGSRIDVVPIPLQLAAG